MTGCVLSPSVKHPRVLWLQPAYLLNGVELDACATVPDADKVIQATADDAGGGTGEGGDIPTVSKHVADPAASQHIPQADGPILSSASQHHGLGKQARSTVAETFLCMGILGPWWVGPWPSLVLPHDPQIPLHGPLT